MARIFILDDDEDFAGALSAFLTKAGHEVEMAYEVEKGFEEVVAKKPDLLILDVMFPEDSSAGFSIARRIRQHSEEMKKLPILMVTSVNSEFALGFGTDDIDDDWLPVTEFIEKPVDFDVLEEQVSRLLP